MATPEGKVKASIRKVLDSYKSGVYYEMAVPYGYGKSGLDFTGCANGRYFSIEAKAPGKRPTDRQKLTIRQQRLAYAPVFVIDGTDAGDVDTLTHLKDWLDAVTSQ
jgi:hypothetical protein